MSASTDEIRLTLINTGGLLEKLREVLAEDGWLKDAQQYACETLHGLLSGEGDDEVVLDAVEEKNFVPSLAKNMEYVYFTFTQLLV